MQEHCDYVLQDLRFLTLQRTLERMFQQELKCQAKVRQSQLETNLNAGVGEAWAGQTRARLRPRWKLCSWAVTAENLGRELPMGSINEDHINKEHNIKLMLLGHPSLYVSI